MEKYAYKITFISNETDTRESRRNKKEAEGTH